MVMTYLTIVGTAVLVPNTLATILGNGVFSLSPADVVWYAPMMFFSTAFASWVAWWWIRRMGSLP